MHIRFHSFVVISIIFLLVACQHSKQENHQSPEQSSPAINATFDTTSLPRYFEPSDSLQTENLPLWMRGGRSGPVRQITFIKDGKYVVTRAEDVTTFVQSVIRVHEFISGKLVQTIRFNGSSSAVSHSGQLLASEEYHTDHYWHDIHIWNLQKGVELRKFAAPSGVNEIAFSSDDKTIATSGDKGFVCLWDVDTGKLLQSYQGFKEDVWNIMFSMDDSLLIARGGFQHECGIKIWNTKTGELKLSIPTHSLDARAIALSPNGEFLVFNKSSDSLSLLQLRSGQISTRFTAKDRFPQTLTISPDSKTLLLGSDGFHDMHMGDDYEKTLLLWRMDDTVPQLELTGHDSDVKTSAFSPDGALIVCGLQNGSVPLWDARTGDLIRIDVNRTSRIRAAAFSVDGESVLTIDAEGVVCKWNSERGHLLSTSHCDGAIGMAAAIHSGEDLIAISETYTGIINFNSAATGKTIKSISIAEEKTPSEQENSSEEETENTASEIEIRQLAFSQYANFLLARTQEEISLIDTKTGASLKRYKTDSQPYTFVAFSQDERQFAASLNNAQTVLVWKTNSQELPIKLLVTDPNYPHHMMFSNDGMYLAVAYHYGPMRIWNLREKKIEQLLEPEASSLAYSCDGNYLATSDIHGIINIWDTKTYSLVLKLNTAFEARYEMLQWSSSRKYLLGLTRDGAIAVWNIPELRK